MQSVFPLLKLQSPTSPKLLPAVCCRRGRIVTIFLAALAYTIAAGLQAGSVDLAMLYVGRAIVGIGMAFGNQASPVSGLIAGQAKLLAFQPAGGSKGTALFGHSTAGHSDIGSRHLSTAGNRH